MISRVRLCTLGILALSISYTGWLAATSAPREIAVYPSAIDLGEANELTQLTTSFEVRNPTNTEYLLTRIETSCHCTIPEKVWPARLKPHKSLNVPLKFDTQRGDGIRQQQVFVLLVPADKPDSRPLVKTVDVQCNILPELRCRPRLVDLGHLGPDDTTRVREFSVHSVSGTTYTVDSITSNDTRLTVTGPKSIGPSGAQFKIEIAAADTVRSGTVGDYLKFHLSGGLVSDFTVPVKAVLRPQYTVSPDVVVFPASSQPGDQRIVRIVSEQEFQVEGIESHSAGFEAVDPRQNTFALRHELRISLKKSVGDSASGSISFSVVDEARRSHSLSIEVTRIGAIGDDAK